MRISNPQSSLLCPVDSSGFPKLCPSSPSSVLPPAVMGHPTPDLPAKIGLVTNASSSTPSPGRCVKLETRPGKLLHLDFLSPAECLVLRSLVLSSIWQRKVHCLLERAERRPGEKTNFRGLG